MCEACPVMVNHNLPGNPPDVFDRDNPCHKLFMECEGDCPECPNKEFFNRCEEVKSVLPLPCS